MTKESVKTATSLAFTEEMQGYVSFGERDFTKGWVKCEDIGGELPVEKGLFNLFVATEEPLLVSADVSGCGGA